MTSPHYDQPEGASSSKAGGTIVAGDVIFLDGATAGLIVSRTYRTNRYTLNVITPEGTFTLNNVDPIWVA